MFAAIFISNFELQAVLRHAPDLDSLPVALLENDSKKARVRQVNALAAQSGVSPGMTSTQAKARCSNITFRTRSKAQEDAAQEILVECAYASAAYIESTGRGLCTIDMRGLTVARAAAAEIARWGENLLQRVASVALYGSVGVAATPGMAVLAARAAQPYLQVTETRTFWERLKIDDLSPSPALTGILSKWGIVTAAQFVALGKSRIAERLGPEGIELFELARADQMRPLKLTAPAQNYVEFIEFEEPIETLEPLLFMVRRFLDQLGQRVGLAGLVMDQVTLSLLLESGEVHERALSIPAPTRDIEVLFRILHNYLENVRTASSIAGLRLSAHTCPAEAQQFQLFETAISNPNRFFEMVGRLNALLGHDRVGTPVPQRTHKPDDFRMEPIKVAKPEAPPGGNREVLRGLMLRRFRPAQPATVRLRHQMPVFVKSARVNSGIRRSSGPWRSSGSWWEQMWSRDEWDIETNDGGLYRLYRDESGWYLDGAYD